MFDCVVIIFCTHKLIDVVSHHIESRAWIMTHIEKRELNFANKDLQSKVTA